MFGDLSSEKPGSKYHIRCRKRLSRAENKACLSLLAVFTLRGFRAEAAYCRPGWKYATQWRNGCF